MQLRKSRSYIIFFMLSRLGIFTGLVIFVSSSLVYLFVPQTIPVSVKLSKFEKITLSGECSSLSSLVTGSGFAGIPPLHITNRATIVSGFDLFANDTAFPFRIMLRGMTVKINLLKGDQIEKVGEYKFSESDGEYFGNAKSISVDFGAFEPIHQSIYYCDSYISIPGDFLSQPIDASSALIQSFIGGKKNAYISISGNVKINQLGVQEPYDAIVFSLEPFPNSELASPLESNFSIYADKLSRSSQFPFGVLDTEWTSSLPMYSIEAETDKIEIYAPIGVLQIGNSKEIPLSSPTQNSTQSLILSPSVFNKVSDLNIETNSETGDVEIFGTTTSIRLNNQELGIIVWNRLPDYVQTGITGLLITFLSGIIANGKKVISFFKPNILALMEGEFVCETRSGYIIVGQLLRKPSKAFPFFELSRVRRRLRNSHEWDIIQSAKFKISASEVEQYYEINEVSKQ